jgi:hypothetical protein
VIALLVGVAAPALAGEKEDLLGAAGAKEHAGDREGALRALERAFEISGDPLIQYDLGRVRQSLGRLAEAIEAFDRFVAEAPAAPRLYRQDAQRRSAELRRQVRMVEIRSDVRGAGVTIDGRRVGQTPLPRLVPVDPGAHRVRLDKVGYDPFERVLAATETLVEGHLVERPQAALTVPPPAVTAAPPRAMAAAPPRAAVLPPPGARLPAAELEASEPAPEDRDGSGTTAITFAAGGMLWSPSAAVTAPAPSLALGISHAVLDLPGEGAVWLGGKVGVAWLPAGDTAVLLPALLTSAARWPVGERWRAFVGVEGGLVLMTGIEPQSRLLEMDAVSRVKSPGLLGAELRGTMGIEYALGPRLSLVFSPQLIVDPRPTPYFTSRALTRVETTLGLSLRP